MKKVFFGLVVALAMSAAMATPGGEHNNTGCNGQGNANSPCAGNGGAGGAGGQGGAGGTGVGLGIGVGVGIAGAASNATAVSANTNSNLNSNANFSANTNANSNTSVSNGGDARSTANGGSGGTASATGNGSGNTTVLNYERSAPSLGGANAPVQVRNCRIGIGFGGSNANGAFTAALPLGNDATCLAGAALEAMEIAGGFSQRSKQTVACTIEGMGELDECKALKESKKASKVTVSVYEAP